MRLSTRMMLACTLLCATIGQVSTLLAEVPGVGDTALDFELPKYAGSDRVKLSKVAESGVVVLVVLRGYPGYQCPACNRQVGEFLAKADSFKSAGAQVLFVYPGAKANLAQRAGEFLEGNSLPDHFTMLIDPDYKFTNAYGLRWDAPKETAYPSTFVIQKDRKISFATISKSHGGRVSADDALKALAAP